MRVLLILIGLVLLVLAFIVGLALICSVVILLAAKLFFKKEKQQDSNQLQLQLPGTDCGSCGLASCREFADEVAENRGFSRYCPYLSEETKEQIQNMYAQRQQELQQRMEKKKKKQKES